jgi:hypothetical protein
MGRRLSSVSLAGGQRTDPTKHSVEILEFWADQRLIAIANRAFVLRVVEDPLARGVADIEAESSTRHRISTRLHRVLADEERPLPPARWPNRDGPVPDLTTSPAPPPGQLQAVPLSKGFQA